MKTPTRQVPYERSRLHRISFGGRCVLLLLTVATAACALVGPRVIHETPSMFGTLVVTDDGNNLRSLRFGRGGITQSTMKVGDPDHLQFGYTKLALAGIALLPEAALASSGTPLAAAPAGARAGNTPALPGRAAQSPRRVLIIGLGGGTLPVFLHRHHPDTLIDVVDIDPAVIAAAKQFFGFAEDARMKAHAGDGRAFVERAPRAHYDLIILDAFGDSEVPSHLATREFLQAVRAALTPDGVVVSNVWRRGYNHLYDNMLRTYAEVFASLHVLESAHEVNNLVFALPQAGAVSREQFAAQAQRVALQGRYRFELGQLVMHSYAAGVVVRNGAEVLRDVPVKRAP